MKIKNELLKNLKSELKITITKLKANNKERTSLEKDKRAIEGAIQWYLKAQNKKKKRENKNGKS